MPAHRLRVALPGIGVSQFELPAGTVRLGRGPDNDFVVPDLSVSNSHCEITLANGVVTARDLNSTNGTFVNGQPVSEAVLQSGQTLQLGSAQLVYEVLESAPPLAPALSVHRAQTADEAAARLESVADEALGALREVLPPAAPAVAFCRKHPTVPAQYICKQCQGTHCGSCVRARTVGTRIKQFCPTCSGECVSISEYRPARPPARRTFFNEVPAAFKYPFAGDGLMLLGCGTVFFVALEGAQFVSRFAGLIGMVASLFLTVFGGGYLFAFMQRIILSSAQGEDRLPGWPEFTEMGSDIIRPFLLGLFLLVVSFGPAIAYLVFAVGEDEANVLLILPLLGLGVIFLPMAMLAVSMTDSFMGVNPLVIIPAIVRVAREYSVACLVLCAVVAVRLLTVEVLRVVLPIPLGALVGGFVALYFLTVEMRVLGILYFTNRERIGWNL